PGQNPPTQNRPKNAPGKRPPHQRPRRYLIDSIRGSPCATPPTSPPAPSPHPTFPGLAPPVGGPSTLSPPDRSAAIAHRCSAQTKQSSEFPPPPPDASLPNHSPGTAAPATTSPPAHTTPCADTTETPASIRRSTCSPTAPA